MNYISDVFFTWDTTSIYINFTLLCGSITLLVNAWDQHEQRIRLLNMLLMSLVFKEILKKLHSLWSQGTKGFAPKSFHVCELVLFVTCGGSFFWNLHVLSKKWDEPIFYWLFFLFFFHVNLKTWTEDADNSGKRRISQFFLYFLLIWSLNHEYCSCGRPPRSKRRWLVATKHGWL